MSSTILTSLHGKKIGLGHKGQLIVNKADESVVGGEVVKTITSAQLLALNATPIELVAAAPAGFAHIVKRITVHKPAGTAYAGIAAGEDLSVKYTDASGAEAVQVETTGFLDQTTAETRVALPAVAAIEPVAAAALVLHLLVGEITTGDSPLYVRVEYDTIKVAFTS